MAASNFGPASMFKALTKAREPMSRVDTAWLRMERPTNLMMITSVLVFDGLLDVARFKALLASRFLAFRRFRQKAVDYSGQAFWEIDRDFDLNWHVRRAALPGQASNLWLFPLAMMACGAGTGLTDVLMNARVAAMENARAQPLMNLCHAAYSFGYAGGAMWSEICQRMSI